jgi:predicted RNA binding protein YcfA (HicA-like mRNA interferase family)
LINYKKFYKIHIYEIQRACEIAGKNGFRIAKEKGSIRYYTKPDWNKLIRVDYHKTKEVPTGTCSAILKAAGIKRNNK